MPIAGVGILVLLASPILAIVLGVASLRRIDRSEGQLSGRGLAIGAVILGVLGLVAVPAILIVGFLMPHQAVPAAVNVNVNTPVVEVEVNADEDGDAVVNVSPPAPVPAPRTPAVSAPVVQPPPATSLRGSVSVQPKSPVKAGTSKKTEFEF